VKVVMIVSKVRGKLDYIGLPLGFRDESILSWIRVLNNGWSLKGNKLIILVEFVVIEEGKQSD
jgi:hypothetical protein